MSDLLSPGRFTEQLTHDDKVDDVRSDVEGAKKHITEDSLTSFDVNDVKSGGDEAGVNAEAGTTSRKSDHSDNQFLQYHQTLDVGTYKTR